MVTVSLLFLHGDIVVFYCSSKLSATPTKVVSYKSCYYDSYALLYFVVYNVLNFNKIVNSNVF